MQMTVKAETEFCFCQLFQKPGVDDPVFKRTFRGMMKHCHLDGTGKNRVVADAVQGPGNCSGMNGGSFGKMVIELPCGIETQNEQVAFGKKWRVA